MKHTFIPTLLALGLAAWATDDKKPVAPDNSGKNARDRAGENKTPLDQSNAPADLNLVKTIRQAVVKAEGLSATAKNVKIITAGGKVTLRGPVNSEEEKKKIEQIAKTAAGEGQVDNQLEVKAPAKP